MLKAQVPVLRFRLNRTNPASFSPKYLPVLQFRLNRNRNTGTLLFFALVGGADAG